LAIILLAGGGYWTYNSYLSPEAKQRRAANENYERLYKGLVTDFEEAMKADTWGGKTPQETLDLFVEALRADDIELAAKYFHIETNTEDPDYLTRRKWEENLEKIVEEYGIDRTIALLENNQFTGVALWNENLAGFDLLGDNGKVIGTIGLRFNTRSGVWKIESL